MASKPYNGEDQIIIANEFGFHLTKHFRQVVLYFGLVGNEQITPLAVSIGIVERHQNVGVNVNQQRPFSLPGLCLAPWTACKAHIGIGVEREVIVRRQVSESRFFFLSSHGYFKQSEG